MSLLTEKEEKDIETVYKICISFYNHIPDFRERSLQKLLSSFKNLGFSLEECKELSLFHEKNIYSTTLKEFGNNFKNDIHDNTFRQIYNDYLINIVRNCSKENKTIKNLITAKINLSSLAEMELWPEKNEEILKDIKLRDNITISYFESLFYKCKKCGKNKFTVEEKQNRRSDEGADTVYKCMSCGEKFIVG